MAFANSERLYEDYLGHGEKVLVVDDEETQREIACGILAKLGYTAEAVSSGEEAVEYLKEQQVDLVVLDLVMPKGTGCSIPENPVRIVSFENNSGDSISEWN